MEHRGVTLAFLLAAVPACDLPQDPEGTLDRARGGTLRVGVIPNEPWTRVEGQEVSGVEADLVREFAATLDAEVEWVPTGPDALASLEHFELDLVVGGLERTNPWKQKVGFTRPWFVEDVCVGERDVAAGAPLHVVEGDPAVRKVRGDYPIASVDELTADLPLVLAPEWRLEAWGHRVVECPLRVEHAMAVPPGENALAGALERFLADREPEIRARLVEEAG